MKRTWWTRWPARALVALAGATALAVPGSASAHPLDVYLQASYVTVAPDGIDLELDLSPGALVAGSVVDQLDTNADHKFEKSEGLAFAHRAATTLTVTVDGDSTPATVTDVGLPTYQAAVAGYGQIKVLLHAVHPMKAGQHRVTFTNSSTASHSAFQANAFLATDVHAAIGAQTRAPDQSELAFPVTIRTAGSAAGTATHAGSGSSGPPALLAIGITGALLAAGAVPLRRMLERHRRAIRSPLRGPPGVHS